ncbi:MAG: 16S rRNA (cytosine(1402)-N(4))-methyltransferase RsmH [Zetaproteobacteria bacterium]|nr:MAG: 16S rRNA (cytosine(1402)-N(4))-methyltransferase RsmH [Zetaproteobacteria bacterium]
MDRDVHVPVLLDEWVDALVLDPAGCYVDATFGRGGHSRAILRRLSERGRLLALDRDPEACRVGLELAKQDARFQIRHAPFARLDAELDALGWREVSGVGFDLGVSSPQVDDAARGFSFRRPGPLDMRMDPGAGEPLTRRLRGVSERELTRIIRELGGERFAGRIARAILRAVREGRMESTADLEHVCFHAVPRAARHGAIHPATRTFQALRMWVNDELGQLRDGILAAQRRLRRPGGRLVVIAFHSGEDRLVRDLVDQAVSPCVCPPQLPMCVCGRKPSMRWVRKKPLRPSEAEVMRNPRSRSARMRVAEAVA